MNVSINSAVFMCFVLLLGCRLGRDNESQAAEASDSADSVQNQSVVLLSVVDGAEISMSPAEVVSHAAAQSTTYYRPAGCVTTTVDGVTLSYVFNNCTGPYGQVFTRGTVNVAITGVDASGVHYSANATGLEVEVRGGTSVVDFESEGV